MQQFHFTFGYSSALVVADSTMVRIVSIETIISCVQLVPLSVPVEMVENHAKTNQTAEVHYAYGFTTLHSNAQHSMLANDVPWSLKVNTLTSPVAVGKIRSISREKVKGCPKQKDPEVRNKFLIKNPVKKMKRAFGRPRFRIVTPMIEYWSCGPLSWLWLIRQWLMISLATVFSQPACFSSCLASAKK